MNITVLTINQAVSYCGVNLDCRQSMQCEFERQGSVLSFRTLFFDGKPCGYMAFMMNNVRENRLCNRKNRWRHWKSTSRKCFLFYTYMKSNNNVWKFHQQSALHMYCPYRGDSSNPNRMMDTSPWSAWLVTKTRPPKFYRAEWVTVLWFFFILAYTFIFLLWELNMKSSWVAIWTATQDRC